MAGANATTKMHAAYYCHQNMPALTAENLVSSILLVAQIKIHTTAADYHCLVLLHIPLKFQLLNLVFLISLCLKTGEQMKEFLKSLFASPILIEIFE